MCGVLGGVKCLKSFEWRQYWICTQKLLIIVAICETKMSQECLWCLNLLQFGTGWSTFTIYKLVLVKAFVSNILIWNNSPLLRAFAKQKEKLTGKLNSLLQLDLNIYFSCAFPVKLALKIAEFVQLWSLFIILSCGAIMCSTFYNKTTTIKYGYATLFALLKTKLFIINYYYKKSAIIHCKGKLEVPSFKCK